MQEVVGIGADLLRLHVADAAAYIRSVLEEPVRLGSTLPGFGPGVGFRLGFRLKVRGDGALA